MRRLQMVLTLCVVPLLSLFMCAQTAPNPSAGILLVANKGDNSVGIIDPVAGKQVAEVAEGGVTGHEIAASPDGRLAYVPIYGNSGVGQPGTDGSNMVVIDLATRKVTGNLDFGKGVRPHCAVFGPKNGLLYVSTELENSITITPSWAELSASIANERFERWLQDLMPQTPEQVDQVRHSAIKVQEDPEYQKTIRRLVSGIPREDITDLSK